MIENIYVRVKRQHNTVVADYAPYRNGVRLVEVKQIPVRVEDNENDWVFDFVDTGKGVKTMAVF